jgi:hypothetical protein
MEKDKPPKPDTLLRNPQILAAIIGGVVTILVAIIGIVPVLVNNQPTPTLQPTVIVVTATSESTSTPEVVSTLTSSPVPVSNLSTMQNQPIASDGNVLLIYDDVSFSLRNQSDQNISLEGITFESKAGRWDASGWGPGVYDRLPGEQCLRLRDATVGQRQPPTACRDQIYGLLEVGRSAMFWVGADSFDVVRDGTVIAVCQRAETSCLISV